MKPVARDVILARVRKGLEEPSTAPAHGPLLPGSDSLPGGSRPIPGIPRGYRTSGSLPRAEVLDLFSARVSDYRASVFRAPGREIHRAVGRALERGGISRLVVPEDLPPEWLAGFQEGPGEVLRDGVGDSLLSRGQVASCHGVLTGCALGIAETGTIVLDAGRNQGRRALTLLPDYHLCVILASQIVETVPEALRVVGAGLGDHRRPLTLVSGPSATSDIELIRVEGVHGPRKLEVILVEEEVMP